MFQKVRDTTGSPEWRAAEAGSQCEAVAAKQKLADHISTCLDRAAIAEQRAEEVGDPILKRCYDEMAKTWRHLAASYELERFVINLHRTKNAPPIAPL